MWWVKKGINSKSGACYVDESKVAFRCIRLLLISNDDEKQDDQGDIRQVDEMYVVLEEAIYQGKHWEYNGEQESKVSGIMIANQPDEIGLSSSLPLE